MDCSFPFAGFFETKSYFWVMCKRRKYVMLKVKKWVNTRQKKEGRENCMKRKGKRMAAMLLAIGLILSDIPVTAWAVSPEYLTETEAATSGTEAATPETEATTPETEAATPPATESAPAAETVSEGDIVAEPAKEITPVRAENALTALYITENAESGVISVDVTKDAEGNGWHYEAAAGTLTLEGFHGENITAEGNLLLKLSQNNYITAATPGKCGLDVCGTLTVDKTDSDTGDILTVAGAADGTKCKYLIFVGDSDGNSQKMEIKGGTLIISSPKAEQSEGYAVKADITVSGAANLQAETVSNFTDNLLILESSGETNIRVERASAYVGALSSQLWVRGSGPVSIEARNPETGEYGIAVRYLYEYTGTSKLSFKGGVSTDTGGSICEAKIQEKMSITSLTGNRFILYNRYKEKTNTYGIWFCDPAGNILTEFTMEAVEGDFDITDTPLLDIPELKVGEYYRGMPVKNCLHRIYYYNTGVSYALKEGSSLPEGLTLDRVAGYIDGTPTAECPAGKVVVVATKASTGETAEVEIAYGAVTVATPVTGVSLNTATLLLAEGESAGLTATVEPAEASISEVSFKSSDSSIAGISATGNTAVVTAGKPGTARITVTTKQGGMTAYCDVTVKAAVPAVSFDVEKNRITGFVAEKTYEITDKASGEVLQPSFRGRTLVEVPAAWFGKTVCIKEKGADGGDSDAMELVIAHAFADTYSADDKNHWKECVCGEKTEQAPHTYAWKVDTEPTDSSDGEKHRYCTVCGYEEETKVSIPRYLRESLVFTGITAPTEGAEPDYSVGEAGEDCVEITKVAWLSEGNPMVSGAVFEKEKEYCLTVDFTMKGSYHLPVDTAGVATELQNVDAGAVTDKKLSGDASTGYRLTVTFLRAGEAVELTEETVSISGLAESYEYTGEALTPEFLVSYVSGTERRALVRDKHYTVSYEENTQPGYAKVIIRGKGFYKGTVEVRFLIYRQVSDLTLCEAAYTYTGKEILPETEIRDRGILLTAGEDYKVESITDNLMPGYMKITVTGGSNGKYRGSHTFTESIRIKGLPIEGAVVTGLKNAVFTG